MSVRRRVASHPGRVVAGVALVLLVAYPVVVPDATYQQTVLLMAFLLAIQAVGWNIVSGFAGYISLGHSAFLGLGAYTAGILAARTGWNPLWFIPVSAVVAVLVSLVVGAIALRASGHAFVIITIALLLSLQVAAINLPSLTKGTDGITLPLPFWPRELQNVPFYYLFLVLLVAVFAFSWWIRRTKFGTGLVAIREDEGKAAATGVNTTVYKVLAFAASTVFSGAAGAGYAYFQTFLNPAGAFNLVMSVTIVLAVLLGGRGTLWGPVVGAFIVHFAMEGATVYGGGTASRPLLLGAILVLVVLFLPTGLVPTVQAFLRRRATVGRAVAYTDQAGAVGRPQARVAERARPEPRAERALLEISQVRRSFGGVHAVDGVDLAVAAGSITGLIGPNGSGKTTLFNLVTGTLRPGAGEIRYDGRRIDTLPPWSRAHLGVSRTFQVTRPFGGLSVIENVVAPMSSFRWRGLVANAVDGAETERARELLAFVGLADLATQPAGTLSYGQLKLMEIAQALMLEPRLVLLDEPAGGVNPSLVNRIADIVRELNAQGVTFLVVEHNIPLVLDLCDPVAVLSRGRIIAEGTPDEVRHDKTVLDAYLGPDDVLPVASARTREAEPS